MSNKKSTNELREKRISTVMQAAGWEHDEALARMMETKELHGIAFGTYVSYGLWKYPLEEQKEAFERMKKVRENKEANVQKAMALSGLSRKEVLEDVNRMFREYRLSSADYVRYELWMDECRVAGKPDQRIRDVLTKSHLCSLLGVPFEGEDETYAGIYYAGFAKKGSLAVVHPSDGNYMYAKRTEQQTRKLARIAMARGAKALLTAIDVKEYPCIVVPEPVIDSMAKIASAMRKRFDVKTVAVTGSIGKTTAASMLEACLGLDYELLSEASKNRNRNRETLAILNRLEEKHTAYLQEVTEAAFGVPKLQSSMILPQIGVVTKIGTSHLKIMGSQERILESCMGLEEGMAEDGIMVLNGDDPYQSAAKPEHRSVLYGIESENLDYRAVNLKNLGTEITFDILHGGKKVPARIHMAGIHNVYNALAAYAACYELGMNESLILRGLSEYSPEGNRQNILEVDGMRLYIDCYNAARESIESSLDTLEQLPEFGTGRRIAVLADVAAIGEQSEVYHREIGESVKHRKLDQIIFYGEMMGHAAKIAQEGAMKVAHTEDEKDLEQMIRSEIASGDTILFKGSNSMKLTKLIERIWGLTGLEE